MVNDGQKAEKRELDEESHTKREIDSDYIWKWIVRLVILILIFYWLFRGLDPSERWIGLITVLLGFNEFRVRSSKSDKDGKSFSIRLGTDKDVAKRVDNEGTESSSLYIDCYPMVPLWPL